MNYLKLEDLRSGIVVWDTKYEEFKYIFFRNREWWYYLFADDNPYYFKFEENRYIVVEVKL